MPRSMTLASWLLMRSPPVLGPCNAAIGFIAELHIVLGAEPVDRFDNIDHVSLAGLRGPNAEVDAAAVDARGRFLLTLRVLHLADKYGNEVFPLCRLQLFAVPGNLIAQVLQKWPHKTILFVSATFLACLDDDWRTAIDRKGFNEADDVTLYVVVDEAELLLHASPPKRSNDECRKSPVTFAIGDRSFFKVLCAMCPHLAPDNRCQLFRLTKELWLVDYEKSKDAL
ncbi:hypothetical protein HY59_08120 [Raoultella ornithinolytica]|nr:hypothetical protein HY59_08120 [Raoultella ornithinolytica]